MDDHHPGSEGPASAEGGSLGMHRFASFVDAAGSAIDLEEAKSNDEMLRVVDWCLMKVVQMEQSLFSLHDFHEEELRRLSIPEDEISNSGISTPVETIQAQETHDPDALKVQKKYIKVYLEREISEAGACMTLPFVLLMLAAFCAATFGDFGHMRTETFHVQDNAIVHDIYENANFAFAGNLPFENGRMGFKNIDDVNSIADFWSWLNSGLLTLFFPADDDWARSEVRSTVMSMCGSFKSLLEGSGWPAQNLRDTEPTANIHGRLLSNAGINCPEPGSGPPNQPMDVYGEDPEAPYLFFNEIVGGMRMRQEYTPEEPCSSNVERFKNKLFKGHCLDFGKHELEPELSKLLVDEQTQLVNTPSAPDVFLKVGWSYKEIRNFTRRLEDAVWFSPYTQRIELLYTTFNPGTNTFTATFIFFIFNRAGHIFKVIEPVTFYIDGYPHSGFYVADIIWSLCILKIFVGEIQDVAVYWRTLGVRKGTAAYISPWNFIDWLNVLYAFVIIGMWFQALQNMNALTDILRGADTLVPGNFQSDAELAQYYDHVVHIVQHQYWLRRIAAFYPFVIVSGFMKPFSQQPRLGVMTETFNRASVDIFHFGVVFMLVFLIYSIVAMILFGQEIDEFANFGRSVSSTFQCLLGTFVGQERLEDGEFPLARTGRFVAAIWLWTLTWLVNLIMLNMLLAIVMDTYSSVKAGIPADAETLWSQAAEIAWRSYYRLKGYWSLSKILSSLDPEFLDGKLDDDDDLEEISVDKMLSMMEGLPHSQAQDILQKSSNLQERDRPGPETTAETARTVSIMEEEMNELLELAKANHLLLCSRTHPFDEHSDEEEEELSLMPSYAS